MKVRLHVGHVVIDEAALERSGAHRFEAALRAELARLLQAGVPAAWRKGGVWAGAEAEAPAAALPRSTGADLGVAVARAIVPRGPR